MDAMVHTPTLMCDCNQLIHHNAEIRMVLKQRHQTKEGATLWNKFPFLLFCFLSVALFVQIKAPKRLHKLLHGEWNYYSTISIQNSSQKPTYQLPHRPFFLLQHLNVEFSTYFLLLLPYTNVALD